MAILQLFELPSRDVSVSQAKAITARALTFREKHEGLEWAVGVGVGGGTGENVAEHQKLRNTKGDVVVSRVLFFVPSRMTQRRKRNASGATLRA